MALPTQTYTWSRVQRAVSSWVSTATGLRRDRPDPGVDPPAQVVWGTYDLAEVPKPFVSLQRLTATNLGFPDRKLREAATQQRITITQTVEGERVSLFLTWDCVTILVAVGASLADTRDALLLALQASVADTTDPLAFASDGAASILVTPFAHWISDVVPLVGCTVDDVTTAVVHVSAVTRRFRVRVQLYGFDGDGLESIDEYCDVLLQSLDDPDEGGGLEVLKRYGVAVQGPPKTAADISAISGALQERRLLFDVSFVAKSVNYRFGVATLEAADPAEVEMIFS